MSLESQQDWAGIRQIGEIVGRTLYLLRQFTRPGLSTKDLDTIALELLARHGARPAPRLAYGFPGAICISVNEEAAHGIPSPAKILKEGDLINIDISAELDGYFADNGASFVIGEAGPIKRRLVECSQSALRKALNVVRAGARINEVGRVVEREARQHGFRVITNLAGHGVGRAIHEAPHEILCYYDKSVKSRFRKNTVVAVETFISSRASYVVERKDGWTLATPDGSWVAQHEHTVIVTDGDPIIVTEANRLWDY
ncbi:type I methionyl aminopeptidase [Larkinella soli]|uniref:type I methionyl aminopeptidase n=1 Tax=Larkinella soli TaxID=1770527 RepID=UPI000FFC45B3|nr:type I methionyl aminopeptidase [Larkinella soli]